MNYPDKPEDFVLSPKEPVMKKPVTFKPCKGCPTPAKCKKAKKCMAKK